MAKKMTVKRFNQMLRDLRITESADTEGKIDYEFLANMLCNYKFRCADEAKERGHDASARAYIEEAMLISEYIDGER